jgi:hypothetical protein
MLTRERSGAPPFLKLSAIGLTSYRCIIIGWNGYTLSVSCPFRFLYRLLSTKLALPLWPLARLAQDEELKNPDAPSVKREAEEDWGR